MPHRLIQIDDLIRGDHFYLEADDVCFYIMEYTSGVGFRYSDTNSLIKNFKKTLDRKHLTEWQYKGRALKQLVDIFKEIMPVDALDGITIVPVPPSKCKKDELHDDRLIQLLTRFTDGHQVDIRELIYLEENIQASHETEDRLSPGELEAAYSINEELCDPPPSRIMIFDDMITAGAHYTACKNILSKRFPAAEIRAVFISRRVTLRQEEDI